MRIYTRTGDAGETGLFHGPRVGKDDVRIEAYGTVDELSAVLGQAVAAGLPDEVASLLQQIQHELFALGAELATPDPAQHGTQLLNGDHIQFLEQQIDIYDADLPPLTTFILPSGSPGGAALHHARVVCRRAERRVVALSRCATLSDVTMTYLNRVGDLLFVLARATNQAAGQPEIAWQRPS